jgi:hypothetical protein
MNGVVAWLLVIVAVATALSIYWYSHPAVRLKRQIRQRLHREKLAHQDLDTAHRRAKNDMERLADWWDRP